MSLLARPLTYHDLDDMPDDGNRYELIGGELIVTAAPSTTHQRLARGLARLMERHLATVDFGEMFFAPLEVRFSQHSKVQPDLLFIRRDRVALLDQGTVIEGAPDLVIEIISPSSRIMDRIRKAALYADHGVPEYWLVDPMERTVEVLKLDDGRYVPVKPDAGGVLASTVIPGLTIDPEALFADIV